MGELEGALLYRLDVLNLQLYLATLVAVLFDVIDNIECAFRLDIASLRTLTESDAVHHIATLGIHKFQLDVLLISPNNLAGAIIINLTGAEERFMVVGAIGGKTLEVGGDTSVDFTEIDFGIDIQDGIGLFGLYILADILLEALAECLNILSRQSQARSVCVTTKILKQVGTALYGFIDIEAGHTTC